jgi:hypothetical protein
MVVSSVSDSEEKAWPTCMQTRSAARVFILGGVRAAACGTQAPHPLSSRTVQKTRYEPGARTPHESEMDVAGGMEQGTTSAQPVVAPSTEVASSSSQRPAAPVKKSAWSKLEDAILQEQARRNGRAENWEAISAALPGRDAKSCRLRWFNHLVPGLETVKPFTPEEDARIVFYQSQYPNKWATIAGFLPGRTDNAIKNRWNTVLRKQQELKDRALRLFPQGSGDVRRYRRGHYIRPVLERLPSADEIDRNAACLELFPLKPGDIVRRSGAVDPMDVDCGAGDPLTERRLWPSPATAP